MKVYPKKGISPTRHYSGDGIETINPTRSGREGNFQDSPKHDQSSC